MYRRLQYISQGSTANEQLKNIQGVLDAGCTWIQLRFKTQDQVELMKLAENVKKVCALYNALFIVNDHVDVAKCIDADGVHLGLQDMPTNHARNILGENKIIGGTANTLQDVTSRIAENCNYVGLGPFRFTTTKEKLSPVLGLNGYERILNAISKNKIQIPIYAIGGITLDDVTPLIRTGVYGVAISGALTNHSNKKDWIEEVFKCLCC